MTKWRRFARREVLVVCNGSDADGHLEVADDLLDIARGVTLLRVEAHAPLTGSGVSCDAQSVLLAGGVVRAGRCADYSLLVVDRRLAVLSRQSGSPPVRVITEPILVAAVVSLALDHIRRSWPLTLVEPDGDLPSPSPVDRRVLCLLTACTTDVEAARRLGITDRQLRRYVNSLQRRLGVRNRFQLGVRSAELRWGQLVSLPSSGSGHPDHQDLEARARVVRPSHQDRTGPPSGR